MHRWPVHIITKSTLVLRDLDLLERIGRATWASVSVTVTTTDRETAGFLKKGAPPPEERLGVVKDIKARAPHVQTGILAIPIVPCFCDSDEALESLVRGAKGAGADYVLFGGGMTLRDRQADWFLRHVKERFPGLIPRFEELYGFRYRAQGYDGAYGPEEEYSKGIHLRMMALLRKVGIPWRMRRWVPRDFRRYNYVIAEKLLNEAYDLQMTGGEWRGKYWAGMNMQNLKESIASVAARGELRGIRSVDDMVEVVILEHVPKQTRLF